MNTLCQKYLSDFLKSRRTALERLSSRSTPLPAWQEIPVDELRTIQKRFEIKKDLDPSSAVQLALNLLNQYRKQQSLKDLNTVLKIHDVLLNSEILSADVERSLLVSLQKEIYAVEDLCRDSGFFSSPL